MRWLPSLAVAACSGDETPKDTGATDADADTDADSDTDTDTDADTDGLQISGAIDFSTTAGGEAECARSYTISGAPYGGGCADGADCLFAFSMTSTESSSTGACAFIDPAMTLTESGSIVDPLLALAEEHMGETNVVFWGHYLDLSAYGGTISGPDWYEFGSSEDPLSTVSWDGENLTIDTTLTQEIPLQSEYLRLCGYYETGTSGPALDPEISTGELPCDGASFDVWEFQGTAGQSVRITLDNGEPAGDPGDTLAPFFQLTDDAGCALVHSIPSFSCVAQPDGAADLQCDTLVWTLPQSGTYRIAVETVDLYGTCTGGVGPYTLVTDVDGSPLAVTVLAEEEPFFQEPIEVVRTSHLSATVTSSR